MAMKIVQHSGEGRERSVFVFKHDTANFSFMYTDLSTEVKLMTLLITVFA